LNQEIQAVKDQAVDQEILVTKRDGSKESIEVFASTDFIKANIIAAVIRVAIKKCLNIFK